MESQYKYTIAVEEHSFAGEGFKISREIKTVAPVVKVTIEQDDFVGMGEGAPLRRYGLTTDSVAAQLKDFCQAQVGLENLDQFPAGPARFALDTALTHIAAQRTGQSLLGSFGIQNNQPVVTAFTLSLDTPDKMQTAARERLAFKTLKLKLGNDDLNIERLAAIHAVAPHANFILDANEALTIPALEKLLPDLLRYPVILMEQPLPAGQDDAFRDFRSPIPFAADESCHTIDDLEKLHGKYQVINVKLDKTGGLHHALKMAERATAMGFDIMIGCMGSTSLAIYPGVLFALKTGARYVDLDGALLLERDPYGFVTYADGCVSLAL
jgi:L-alanine-DL-glutamate epimerase-like enolase superfamily enzyme